ncbi:unnamed protein product [Dovyalis caffra]|uniref:B-like cyclin n=1 Tax=Dovyalis caffra TaxID=77055 RepID=A0AAV1RCH1_9ROSI|nr:unnamed protein product [Dovyalis caffra]
MGGPTFKAGDIFAMMAACFVAVVESTGTIIAASRYGSATPLPPSVLSRGIGWLVGHDPLFCNLNSFRTKFILGFSLFMGLSVPQYFNDYLLVSGRGPIHTGATWFNDVMQVIFSSPATVALIVAYFLDGTHSLGHSTTRRDSGRHWWEKFRYFSQDTRSEEFYALPWNLNSLYCGEDVSEVVQLNADTWISSHHQSPSSSVILSPPSDENTITKLIDSESHFMPLSDYLYRCRHRSIDITARQDSINWILKVHAHYAFRPLTALLSVNYFDRFLSSHSLPENGWPFQLLSVACLSLAAKMEEPDMPLLLDLQILEPGFIFEPKNVQKMELRIMAHFNWRLRSITPFDYLDYFISKLPSCSSTKPDNFNRVLKDSSDLILNTTRVIDFLGFAPSTVAAAAVISAAGKSFDTVPLEAGVGQFFHERVNKETAISCHQLMEEYLVDTCPSARHKEFSAGPPVEPASPVGVLDAAAACGSCDTRSENPISASSQASQTEPIIKRLRSSAPDVQEP